MRLLRDPFLALLASALALPAHGQRPPGAPAPAAADTAIVRVLAGAALEVATPPRAHLAPRTGVFPWRLTVADSLTPTGRRLQQSLARALRARALAPADTVHAFLTVTDVRRVGATLRASIGVGLAWRCPNGAWMRSSTGYRMLAHRVRGVWQRARVDAELHADPAPCDVLAAPREVPSASSEPPLVVAERFIDAFYSFDRARLARELDSAGSAAPRLLYYQGWARGGHYEIRRRPPCVAEPADRVRCAITVADDLIPALGLPTFVTDTFRLTIRAGRVRDVSTSSDDPPVFEEALAWVRRERAAGFRAACAGFFDGGPTPEACVRVVVEGFAAFAARRRPTP